MITKGNTEVLAVYLGETQISAIYKGSDVVFATGVVTYSVTTNLTNITSDAPSIVVEGSSLQVTLSVNTGHYLDNNSVAVTMDGVDITSTAYSNGVVTIAEVTGAVVITAATMFDAEVEYIATDGVAYIDTNYKVSSSLKIDFNIYIQNHSGQNAWLFGSRKDSSSERFAFFHYLTNNQCAWYFGTKSKTLSNKHYDPGTYNFNNLSEARTLKIGNDTYSADSNTFSSNYTIFIFTLNNGGSPALSTIVEGVRFITGKMYNGSTLVRDYIAVRKNGVGYLFDKVNKVLYGNANETGAFTYGNDKNS